jgi:hypothetical protein
LGNAFAIKHLVRETLAVAVIRRSAATFALFLFVTLWGLNVVCARLSICLASARSGARFARVAAFATGLEVWISANASHLGTRKTIFIAFASVAPVVFGTFAFPANIDCIFTVHAPVWCEARGT